MKVLIFSKFGNILVHKNYDDHEKLECPVCNNEIELYWEERYQGIRGMCHNCGINWAES
ncbi:MAG: hypothetical protein WEC35_06640 [Nitrosopumilaceae archaeon]